MPRQIEFAGAPAECKLLLDRLHDHPGIARITLHSGASRVPQGDVLIIEAANQVAGEILNLFREVNLLHSGAVSIIEPNVTIRAHASQTISKEGNDAIWEETGAMMRQAPTHLSTSSH
ncbi:hypothetical protein ABID21_001035 [Pseudorhizobium tarimense]|uniref:Uncharacterized protein n=1 Tax=Pseudorhizobium tarimense TaxID=1079109 RepID=A0ABV2H3B0_9HYPH|nr:hypothetical protein [Pseudorhizobium tarimense]MCJ8518079.1 hypothetical protein [Pseudorhizobium tarimense]